MGVPEEDQRKQEYSNFKAWVSRTYPSESSGLFPGLVGGKGGLTFYNYFNHPYYTEWIAAGSLDSSGTSTIPLGTDEMPGWAMQKGITLPDWRVFQEWATAKEPLTRSGKAMGMRKIPTDKLWDWNVDTGNALYNEFLVSPSAPREPPPPSMMEVLGLKVPPKPSISEALKKALRLTSVSQSTGASGDETPQTPQNELALLLERQQEEAAQKAAEDIRQFNATLESQRLDRESRKTQAAMQLSLQSQQIAAQNEQARLAEKKAVEERIAEAYRQRSQQYAMYRRPAAPAKQNLPQMAANYETWRQRLLSDLKEEEGPASWITYYKVATAVNPYDRPEETEFDIADRKLGSALAEQKYWESEVARQEEGVLPQERVVAPTSQLQHLPGATESGGSPVGGVATELVTTSPSSVDQAALDRAWVALANVDREVEASRKALEEAQGSPQGSSLPIKPISSTPPAPSWLPRFAPGQVAGQPITREPIPPPSLQQLAILPQVEREMLMGYAQYAGQSPQNIMERLAMMKPASPVGAGASRWTPARQRTGMGGRAGF